MRWMLALGLIGCMRSESTFTDSTSSAGVFAVDAKTDRGHLSYSGGQIGFDVTGESYGRGNRAHKAQQRQEANLYSVVVDDGVLFATGESEYTRAGISFDIDGPTQMDVRLDTSSSASIQDAEGFHIVTASNITARNVVGEVDFFATDGMDVQILPWTDVATINLTSTDGDVTIGLPYGLDYDLSVLGDPDHDILIEDLGFDTFVADGDLSLGWYGFRTIQVNVDVQGGAVDVYAL